MDIKALRYKRTIKIKQDITKISRIRFPTMNKSRPQHSPMPDKMHVLMQFPFYKTIQTLNLGTTLISNSCRANQNLQAMITLFFLLLKYLNLLINSVYLGHSNVLHFSKGVSCFFMSVYHYSMSSQVLGIIHLLQHHVLSLQFMKFIL